MVVLIINKLLNSVMKKIFFRVPIALCFLIIQTNISFSQIKTVNGKIIAAKDMDAFIQHQVDSLHIPSLTVAFINNGKIVYDKAYGYADLEKQVKADDNSIYEAASMSKSVLAYFIMRMVDRGVIALDTPLYKYYPYKDIEYDNRYKLITARIVLDHTTGFPNWHQYQPADTSRHLPPGAQYLMFTPGTKWSYSGDGYTYLTHVIAHLLHTDLVGLCDTVYKEVDKPLGMEHANFGWTDYVRDHLATGYRYEKDNPINVKRDVKKMEELEPAGGLRTNAIDYARFMIGMVNGKGLSENSFHEMLKEQAVVDTPKANNPGLYWGLGVAISKTPYGIVYAHSGNNQDFTTGYEIFKDSKSGLVIFANNNLAGYLWNRLEPYFREGKQ
jgi:CubicO group peptidase (beta-lactamase class C family)